MRLALGEFKIVDIKHNVIVIEFLHKPEILLNCIVPYAHNHKIGDLIPIYIWVEPKR